MTRKPGCPEWCTDHSEGAVDDVTLGDDSGPMQHCQNWLFVRYAPASKHDKVATYALGVGNVTFGGDMADHSSGPGMSMTVFGSIPAAVDPEDARALAAALIRGAEIVEASRTATCPECSHRVHPTELKDMSGICVSCYIERNKRRRAALRIVP